MNFHPQANVSTPTGEEISVDQGIVALLQSLWKLGFQTAFSCEGVFHSQWREKMEWYRKCRKAELEGVHYSEAKLEKDLREWFLGSIAKASIRGQGQHPSYVMIVSQDLSELEKVLDLFQSIPNLKIEALRSFNQIRFESDIGFCGEWYDRLTIYFHPRELKRVTEWFAGRANDRPT